MTKREELRAMLDASERASARWDATTNDMPQSILRPALEAHFFGHRPKGMAALRHLTREVLAELEGEVGRLRSVGLDHVDVITERDDRITTLTADLERARAEVRACCGDHTALDPYRPDGWTKGINSPFGPVWKKRVGDTVATVDYCGHWSTIRDGMGLDYRPTYNAITSIFNAWSAADAALTPAPDANP